MSKTLGTMRGKDEMIRRILRLDMYSSSPDYQYQSEHFLDFFINELSLALTTPRTTAQNYKSSTLAQLHKKIIIRGFCPASLNIVKKLQEQQPFFLSSVSEKSFHEKRRKLINLVDQLFENASKINKKKHYYFGTLSRKEWSKIMWVLMATEISKFQDSFLEA